MGRILKGAQLRDGKWVVSAPEAPEVVAAALDEPEIPVEPAIDLDALLAAAQAEAERMLAEAAQEAERVREAARQEGYQSGFAQGDSEGRSQWQARIQAAVAEAQALVEQRKIWLQQSETDVLRLALLTAERILHTEARNRDALLSLIRGALTHLEDAVIVRIRVHPSDASGLAATLNMPELEIKADPAIGLGGVVFETPTGRVDGRFVTQFRELASAVLMADPEDDPVIAPVLSELESSLEAKIPAAEPSWKPV